jgi:hypothetical protein
VTATEPLAPARRAPVFVLLAGAAATLALISAVLVAPSCQPRRGGSACVDSGDCPQEVGELLGCMAGYCEEVSCLSSSDCPMGSFCDVEDDLDCEEGCQSADDCLAGFDCEDGQCRERGCRSTILDCDFGEFCDTGSGQCVEAEGRFCAACDPGDHEWDDQGTVTTCDDTVLSHDFCGGAGAFCIGGEEDGTFCAPACEGPEDCPAGFQCAPVSRGLPAGCEEDYLFLGNACLADCASASGG